MGAGRVPNTQRAGSEAEAMAQIEDRGTCTQQHETGTQAETLNLPLPRPRSTCLRRRHGDPDRLAEPARSAEPLPESVDTIQVTVYFYISGNYSACDGIAQCGVFVQVSFFIRFSSYKEALLQSSIRFTPPGSASSKTQS